MSTNAARNATDEEGTGQTSTTDKGVAATGVAWRDNRYDVLFRSRAATDAALSCAVSRLTGRTVVVVNLADLPHAAPAPSLIGDLTADQTYDRGLSLFRAIEERLPPGHAWDYRDVKDLADITYPAMATNTTDLQTNSRHAGVPVREIARRKDSVQSTPHSTFLPPMVKLTMNHVHAGAGSSRWIVAQGIIFNRDRRWTPEQTWRQLTMLQAEDLENWPGKAMPALADLDAESDITLLHETAHAMQPRDSCPAEASRVFLRECDADLFAHGEFLARADRCEREGLLDEALLRRETVDASRKFRALRGFLHARPERRTHWIALVLDAIDRGARPPDAHACWAATMELRLRVACRMAREGRPDAMPDAERIAAIPAHVLDGLVREWVATPGVWETDAARAANHAPNYSRHGIGPATASAVNRALRLVMGDHWKSIAVPRLALPVVRALLEEDALADRHVRRAAELIVEAGRYFCPKLLAGNIRDEPEAAPGGAPQPLAACRDLPHL